MLSKVCVLEGLQLNDLKTSLTCNNALPKVLEGLQLNDLKTFPTNRIAVVLVLEGLQLNDLKTEMIADRIRR